MTFNIGDKVRANGREATLAGYDEGSDRLAYAVTERSGSVNIFYGHISSTTLESLEPGDVEEDIDGLLTALSTIDSSPDLTAVPVLADSE